MKTTRRWLLALLVALLVCCGLATAAIAADGRTPDAAAGDSADKGYELREDIEIEDDETPLAAGTVETRCVLHVVLFLFALVLAACFLYSCQKHRARQGELMARLGRRA